MIYPTFYFDLFCFSLIHEAMKWTSEWKNQSRIKAIKFSKLIFSVFWECKTQEAFFASFVM